MSAIEHQAMDPRKAECRGLYLYGSGYFAKEDQRMGILRGERTEAAFCNECPVKRSCEREHGRRVKELKPQDVEEFEHEVKVGARHGLSRVLVGVVRAKAGNPDPYMAVAVENYHRGVRARAESAPA